MSRIGKLPVTVPSGVDVTLADSTVVVKGPKGRLEQRVLPVLRGRGPKFTTRVRALGEKLTEKGLERSARHVQDALALAEVNFGDVDFLAY